MRLSELELMCVTQLLLFATVSSMEAKPLNGAEVSQWVGKTFKRMQQVMGKEYSLDPMLPSVLEGKEKGGVITPHPVPLGTSTRTTQSEKKL